MPKQCYLYKPARSLPTQFKAQTRKTQMKKIRSGFTLIELMVVLAILAILAGLATPSYLNKVIREQIQAGMVLADVAKKPVETYWGITNKFPENNAIMDLPSADKIVSNLISSVDVKDGVVTLTFGNNANRFLQGRKLSFRPAYVADAKLVPIAWVCGYAKAPSPMTVQGNDFSDIPNKYLPAACRKFD